MHILKEVCFITTSFPAIHFFYDSVIISREHLKKPTCKGNCVYFTRLFATIHYNKLSEVDSRKSWRVCLFQENHCGPALLEVPIYSTELVAITFFENYCVKCTQVLKKSQSFMVNQHSEITLIGHRIKYRNFFRRAVINNGTCKCDFRDSYFLQRAALPEYFQP